MMNELMEAEEWINDEEWIEDSWMVLEKARGEKVIKYSKKKIEASKNNYSSLEGIIIIFEDTDNINIEESYGIKINGNKIVVGKRHENNTSFKEVDVKKFKGKKFLEYVAGQIENITGRDLDLTLAFEKGYSIEISNYSLIEEYK